MAGLQLPGRCQVTQHTDQPTTPRAECQHKRTTHMHGTHVCYTICKCRCDQCRAAARRYENHRTRQRAYYGPAYVDAQPVREHLRALMAEGLGWKRIATLAGLNSSVIYPILYGRSDRNNAAPRTKVRPETARKILAVAANLDNLGATARIDGTGTRRRLQALVAIGWSQAELGRRLGITPSNTPALFRGQDSGLVHAATARKARALYNQLWATPPPETTHRQKINASRARNFARNNGWPPPLAWDDDTIDDPTQTYYFEEDEPPGRRGPRTPIHLEDVDELARQGETWDAVTTRLHVSRAGIEMACARQGRRDLLARLAVNSGTATDRHHELLTAGEAVAS